ncbi:hypothetical protein AMELA_G00268810 [Ameiurus melas]|uniref:Uncharacterized protein n=1 Tax=Ameiurus melas TaxID=219545 RepID=A0A7J5ZMN6_AMEME|nr:hypothetical protein AMELA_G00268810 [Ameiurus melas]
MQGKVPCFAWVYSCGNKARLRLLIREADTHSPVSIQFHYAGWIKTFLRYIASTAAGDVTRHPASVGVS